MKRAEDSSTFSSIASAKEKIIVLGQMGPLFADLIAQTRSFSIEHVSPATLVQQEISRRTPQGQQAAAAIQRGSAVSEQLTLAVLRKWFWARKPDAGFLLEDFPATLLQAKVYDEWLEARGENLTAVLSADSAPAEIVTHYRTQGLPPGVTRTAA
ncbi:MAG: nucleoside monophosphate kinase [Candidatus Didemnitutus sp.]|nr:nucleoside monophosphate kinase [Candidatus Didemnitutus sp.]